jgi:glutathione S-transferase
MKLYYAPGVCSLSPHIVLKESGLPFEAIKTDIRNKTTDGGGDYRKTNPLGDVPALELDDGTILTEGPAIVQYIADKVPAKNLAPANGTLERYQLQSWLNFVSTEVHKGYSPLFNPAVPDDVKTVFRERLMTRLAHLDKHLATNDYVMGKSFSVVDAYVFTTLGWAPRVNVDLSGFPNLAKFRERMMARPSVQAAMKAEGLIK